MKKIGIGYENYKEFIDKDMYYIDKTMLINDIIEKGGKVTLFTRPRCFGKTLALSTPAKQPNFETAFKKLRDEIISEFSDGSGALYDCSENFVNCAEKVS